MMRLTYHAYERITNRLASLTSEQEVLQACQGNERESYHIAVVKKLDKFTVIDEGEYSESSKGDELVAVCRNGKIVTVMLRKSTSTSERYDT